MFGETLLESSPVARRNKRWPMATAFIIELIVAGVLITVPLLSTGVIPVFARVPIYTPVKPVKIEPVRPLPNSGSGPSTGVPHTTAVALVTDNPNHIYLGDPPTTDTPTPTDLDPRDRSNNPLDEMFSKRGNDKNGPGVRPGDGPPRIKVSILEEARLVKRVDPIYPRMAILTGIRGEVKLHAIIARNGSIQSLSVTSGHPMLATAALDAVRQWKYQPYILNGNPVEVDTFITVNFKRAGD